MNQLAKKAAEFDASDALASKRDLFHRPGGLIYLDGNSLGLMPKTVADRLAAVAREEWAKGLIRSWSDAAWFELPIKVGDRIAPLIGVGAGEVAVGDSTSINLFKCLAAALQLQAKRHVILAEGDNFPTDSYIAQGLAALVPDVELRYFEKGEDPVDHVNHEVAVLLLSHVDYRSSLIRDMKSITSKAQEKGALVLWDLSHTTGAVACDLQGASADFAVGCTYKYLNGGPGAPAFAWANPQHVAELQQPLSGWMGHAAPFDFTRSYAPAEGARQFVCGTPQVLSLSALDEGLKLWDDVDLPELWAKSQAMTSYFIEAVESLCANQGLKLVSPRDNRLRGSHVSFDLDVGGFEVMQAMTARGVIGDFRAPGTLRFGFSPLYLSFSEVLAAATHLSQVLGTGEWDDDKFRIRGAVT